MRLSAYIKYVFTAKTRHSIHSPFVYSFMEEVIRNKTHFPVFDDIERFKKNLLTDATLLNLTDFGEVKSFNGEARYRKESVGSIIKKTAINKKNGEFLYLLVRFMRPINIIEVGTSLGISTLYLAKAANDVPIYTLEGCPEKTKAAKGFFDQMQLKNIRQYTGRFDDTLPQVLNDMQEVGLAYVDGNHTYRATKAYFEMLMDKVKNNSVLIFDDIHWSEGMQRAWNEIIMHPGVTVSMDLYRIGIVFFNKELSKQHFVLRT